MNEIGKIPPQAIDIEEALIGTILFDAECFDNVISIINSECFYKDTHKIIFQSFEYLYKESKNIDIVTVSNYLREKNKLEDVGGPKNITSLTINIFSTAHVENHARIIKEKYLKREFIRIASSLIEKSFNEDDLQDITDFAEKELLNITESTTIKEAENISNVIPDVLTKIEQIQKNKNKLSGVPSGLTKLDRITTGWQNSDLIILAARPSMGKTALALNFAYNCAEIHGPCLLFSLEMSSNQLGNRFLSMISEVDAQDLRTGNVNNSSWNKINTSLNKFDNLPLYIDDNSSLTIYELRSRARRYKKKYDIKLIIIDYLQLLKGDKAFKNNLPEYYGSISKMCKSIAKELDIPVICLSQLNRSIETRGNKFPELSDLRSSGEIEQDADLVIFPTRYRRINIEQTEDLKPAFNLAKIDIKKHRNGPIDYVDVWVSDDVARWRDEESESSIITPF